MPVHGLQLAYLWAAKRGTGLQILQKGFLDEMNHRISTNQKFSCASDSCVAIPLPSFHEGDHVLSTSVLETGH